MRDVERRVVLFEDIVSEIFGKRGNQWNSKKHIDVEMLKMNTNYGFYVPTIEEIDDTVCFIFRQGITKPCIVLVEDRDILWDGKNGGPIIFNAAISREDERTNNIQEEHKYIEDNELMLSWTHLDCNDYDREGYFTICKEHPFGDSTRYDEDIPIPAIAITFTEMAKKLKVKKVTLDALRLLPTATIADLSQGYEVFCINDSEPCFLMIGNKILCNRYAHARLPYLYNAEGYKVDSYVEQKMDDIPIYEHEWDIDAEIAVRFKKEHIEDWR